MLLCVWELSDVERSSHLPRASSANAKPEAARGFRQRRGDGGWQVEQWPQPTPDGSAEHFAGLVFSFVGEGLEGEKPRGSSGGLLPSMRSNCLASSGESALTVK